MAHGIRPTGREAEDLFLIDDDQRDSTVPVLGVLPKQRAVSGAQFVGEDGRFCCEVLRCIETGENFDVAELKMNAIRGTGFETLST
jgi:hypothetical protein